MRVGIDISPLRERYAGVGSYCFGLLEGFGSLSDCVAPEILGYATGLSSPVLPDGVRPLSARWIPAPTRVCFALWDLMGRPYLESVLGPVDIIHGTNYLLPPTRRARRVVTVHDLAFLVKPEWASPRARRFLTPRIRAVCHAADHVLACSEATKADVVRLLGVPEDRVGVAYEGVSAAFRPVARDVARARLAEVLGVPEPYFLFVGTIEPRKNLSTLARAFETLRDDLPHRLVLCGSLGWHTEPILQALGALGDRAVRLGYVSRADLPGLYSAATACVLPSWYEGFGLTALEAMACGCPVLASTAGSLPEVVGDAGLLLPPDDAAAWSEALRRVASDQGLRDRLSSEGIRRAGVFTWRNCAERTLAAYTQALGS